MLRKRLLFSIIVCIALQNFNVPFVSAASKKAPVYPVTRWCIAVPVLRVRDMPSTDGEIVGKIPYGTSVLVLGEKSSEQTIGGKTGRWVEIQFRGRQGYAFDAFFSAKEPTVTVEGIEKKTSALVNSFKKEQDRCEIELVDGKGKVFVEIAETVELCEDELLGKRVKISYARNKSCQKGSSCPAVTIHQLSVINYQ